MMGSASSVHVCLVLASWDEAPQSDDLSKAGVGDPEVLCCQARALQREFMHGEPDQGCVVPVARTQQGPSKDGRLPTASTLRSIVYKKHAANHVINGILVYCHTSSSPRILIRTLFAKMTAVLFSARTGTLVSRRNIMSDGRFSGLGAGMIYGH